MLIIIDLQEKYLEAFLKRKNEWETFLSAFKIRFEEAKSSRERVINLSYFLDGLTIPQITEIIEGYYRKYNLLKFEEDGSSYLDSFIRKKNFPKEQIELCGAFRNICVLKTWKGLKEKGYSLLPVREELSIGRGGDDAFPKGFFQPRNSPK